MDGRAKHSRLALGVEALKHDLADLSLLVHPHTTEERLHSGSRCPHKDTDCYRRKSSHIASSPNIERHML